jgi:ADP-ribose pyrophosphatase
MARRLDLLTHILNTPGITNEALRVFLARDLSPVPAAERYQRAEEEAAMEVRWVPLDELVARVLDGSLHNPSTIVGVLSAYAARAGRWAALRPADAPWPYRRGSLPT